VSGADAPWLSLADEAATLAFGARLARALPDGAAPLVLYLHGDLGAGKTTLARGMLRQLGESGPVRSPTFALLAQYFPGGRAVVHLDLYRLDAPAELLALGLADYLQGSVLWLVEWPEKGQGTGLPAPDAHVYLEPEASARRVHIEAASPLGRQWAGAVAADSGS
jgi:tRNA threonylcarbamoyladenosine biosynthesis protein TsaE